MNQIHVTDVSLHCIYHSVAR